MECNPCSYSVTSSPFFGSKHFFCRVWEKGKKVPNCLWDALILNITGAFLLHIRQFPNPAEGRQAFPERADPWQHVVLKSETYTERSVWRTYSPGPWKKTMIQELSHSFVQNLSCLRLFKNYVLAAKCIAVYLLRSHIFPQQRQRRKWHVVPCLKTLDTRVFTRHESNVRKIKLKQRCQSIFPLQSCSEKSRRWGRSAAWCGILISGNISLSHQCLLCLFFATIWHKKQGLQLKLGTYCILIVNILIFTLFFCPFLTGTLDFPISSINKGL